ncbi:MAG: hypothetical protein AAFV47_12535, partial [Pseudomonadota bacterium]
YGSQFHDFSVAGVAAEGRIAVTWQEETVALSGGETATLRRPDWSIETALEFIDDDELVEVTPTSIRLRKKLLGESDRKRASRQAKAG